MRLGLLVRCHPDHPRTNPCNVPLDAVGRIVHVYGNERVTVQFLPPYDAPGYGWIDRGEWGHWDFMTHWLLTVDTNSEVDE